MHGNEAGENPHVNYEPSAKGGLREAPKPGADHKPYVAGHVVRQTISRTNNYGQAGARYRTFSDEERDELISNLVAHLSACDRDIQERMIGHLLQCDQQYGQRVAAGLGIKPEQLTGEAIGAR